MPTGRAFHGYYVAAAATVALFATAPGQTFIISQLNTVVRETFGITELTLNTAYAIATVAAGLPLVLVGRWTDRIGPRAMMALIALLFGLACMFMTVVSGAATLFIAFFLLRFLGQGCLAMVGQHALAMWFHRRLGSVHGVMQVVVFTSWILLPQLAVRLIEALGWRTSYAIFGIAVWIAVIPLALLLVRNRPEELGLRMDNDPPEEHAHPSSPEPRASLEPAFTLKEAARTRAYWIIAAVFFTSPLIGTAFLFDIQPLLTGRGLSATGAATVVSAWTATMAAMALPSGILTDRFRPALLITLGLCATAASSAVLIFAASLLTAAAGLVLFGIGQSILSTCAGATIARYFGRTHHGAIRSSTIRIGVFGTGLGTIFTGVSIAATGGYTAAFIAFIIMALALAAFAITLRPPTHDKRGAKNEAPAPLDAGAA